MTKCLIRGLLLTGFACMIASAAPRAAGQVFVNFNVPGPASWNVGGNWDPPNIPDVQFNEIAVINGGRTAFVDTAVPQVGGVDLDVGTLEIRSGGTLNLVAGSEAGVSGQLFVGFAGQSTLLVKRGGTLSAGRLFTGGNVNSSITVGETTGSGTATFNFANGQLNRTLRIVGANANVASSGSVLFLGTQRYEPVITSATFNGVQAAGAVNMGGSVRPELSGYTPVLGNSWRLVAGESVSGQFNLDRSLLPATPRGVSYYLTQSATEARLNYSNLLILNVDRGTGAVTIENAVGNPIAIHGYTISSNDAVFNGAWNSLQDQGLAAWDEADNASARRLTEFKTSGSTSVAVGTSLNLGSPFSPTPAAFGEQPGTDLKFQYLVPDGNVLNGTVEFTGAHNNLVLTIDPATGEAAIQNQSKYFDVSIDAYTITSTSGKLLTANGAWNSLQDQGLAAWDQADNSNANRITEFKTSGATAMTRGGTVLDLGAPINLGAGALAIEDFGLEFKLSTGQTLAGIVEFGAIPGFVPPGGDYNGDGAVNGNDFLVWQRTLGSNVTAAGTGADGSGNGVIDAADLTVWRNGFGSAVAAATGSVAAVPEPTSLASLLTAIAVAAAAGRRRTA